MTTDTTNTERLAFEAWLNTVRDRNGAIDEWIFSRREAAFKAWCARAALAEAEGQSAQRSDAEAELNCAGEVLDGYAVNLALEQTDFDCIGDYIKAVVDAALAKAEGQVVPQGWLPIETAPKDGSEILVYCQKVGVCGPAKWNADRYAKKPRPYWTHWGESIWGVRYVRDDQPTHWKPIPASPGVAAPEAPVLPEQKPLDTDIAQIASESLWSLYQRSDAAPEAPAPTATNGQTLWLWKNGDHFLAFSNLYPCYSPGGDPMTLGEPFGRAVFKRSCNRDTAPEAPAVPKVCRADGRCQYAIDHGAEGMAACPPGKCAQPVPAAPTCKHPSCAQVGRCLAVEWGLTEHPEAAPTAPLDMPLPCDIKIGNGTHRKGTSLRGLVLRMESLHHAAFGDPPSPEQQAANLAALQACAAAPTVAEPVAWACQDLDGMVEAFSRVIEAHAHKKNPFHNPVDADARMALRTLRGFIPAMKALASTPSRAPREPLTEAEIKAGFETSFPYAPGLHDLVEFAAGVRFAERHYSGADRGQG